MEQVFQTTILRVLVGRNSDCTRRLSDGSGCHWSILRSRKAGANGGVEGNDVENVEGMDVLEM